MKTTFCLALAVLTGCAPPPATIQLKNGISGADFTYNVAIPTTTYGFSQEELGKMADYPSGVGTSGPMTRATLHAFVPLELLLLEDSFVNVQKLDATGRPVIIATDLPRYFLVRSLGHYARIHPEGASWLFQSPGSSGPPPRLDAALSIPVRAARFVNHGMCSRRVPWGVSASIMPPRATGTFFSELDQSIRGEFAKAINAKQVTLDIEFAEYSPAFLRPAGINQPYVDNLDGFALHYKMELIKGNGSWTVDLHATYRLTIAPDGLPGVELVGMLWNGQQDDTLTGLLSSDPSPELADTFRAAFPKSFHDAMRAKFSGELASRQPDGKLGLGLSCPVADPAAGDAYCREKGPAFIRGFLKGTKPTLDTSKWVFHDKSFTCEPDPKAPADPGICRWHPVFNRLNIMPEYLELVWADYGDGNFDKDIAMALDPNLEVCSSAETQVTSAPQKFRVAWYGPSFHPAP